DRSHRSAAGVGILEISARRPRCPQCRSCAGWSSRKRTSWRQSVKRLEWPPDLLCALTAGLHVRPFALGKDWKWVLALDAGIVTVGFEAAVALRFIDSPLFPQQMATFLAPSILVGVLYAMVACLLGLHRRAWRYASV